MANFFGLVKNEYVKILKKTSTKIMLAIIVLAAFGLSALMLVVGNNNEDYYDYSGTKEAYNDSISWLDTTKPENGEARKAAYQYLIDNDISGTDWRIDVVYNIDNDSISNEQIETVMNVVKNNDWRAYCQLMLDNSSQAGDKWAYGYRLENNVGFDDEFSKQNTIIETVRDAKNQLELSDSGSQANSPEKTKLEDKITLGVYQLDNEEYDNTANASDTGEVNFWSVFSMTPNLVSIIGLLMIVIAGGSVSSEFHQGTIKFLLINPVKRWKILMSKYFTCITMGYLFLILTYLICIPATGLLHGFEGLSTPYLYVDGGSVHEMSSFLNAAKTYLLNSINVVAIATLAFAISSLVRSSALAIGVSVFLMFAGSTITALLAELGQDWGRYLVFANTDLAQISQGNSLFTQHSLTFALVVLAAHMVVFILTAWDGFTKRSV